MVRPPEATWTVIVANPMIADVSLQTNGVVIVLTGKSFGATNLIALDRLGACSRRRRSASRRSRPRGHGPLGNEAKILSVHAEMPAVPATRRSDVVFRRGEQAFLTLMHYRRISTEFREKEPPDADQSAINIWKSPMKSITFQSRPGGLPLALDLIERLVAVTFFGFFALRLLPPYMETGSTIYLLLLFSECLVVVFILIRHTTSSISLSPVQWCIAIAGTTMPMLIEAGGEPLVPMGVCAAFMLMGVGINIWAKLSLRRSFGVVAANRGVKTRGPYVFIRHPMYFGYVLTQIGFLLSNPTAWNTTIYTAALALQVLRISAEETILFRDTKYRTYATNVRYRLIPGIF